MCPSFTNALLACLSLFPVVPVPGEKGEFTPIPLESVYFTGPQAGVRSLPSEPGDRASKLFLALSTKTKGIGASTAFLASGKDLEAAMSSSLSVLTEGRRADHLLAAPDEPRVQPRWLVAYLGSGEDGAYKLVSVSHRENCFRVTYARLAKAENRQHFIFCPLGPLGPGEYFLELCEADSGEITLMRRVRIGKD